MRIGILARYLYSEVGGIEVFCHGLRESLEKSGHSVFMYSAGPPRKSGKEHAYSFFTLLNEPFFFPMDIFKDNIDVLHLQYPSPWCFICSVLFRILKNKPVVITYHSNPASSSLIMILGGIFDFLIFYPICFLFGFDLVFTYRALKPRWIKGEVIRNGIRDIFFRKRARKRTIDIIYAGRFVRHKHPEMILSAVKRSGLSLRIVFVGEGPLDESLKELASIENVKAEFPGRVSEERIAYLLSISRILVLASEMEGDPLIVGEALASGCVVFATPVGSIPETIPHEWLFHNENEFMEKLRNFKKLEPFWNDVRMPVDEETCFKKYLRLFDSL